MGLHLWQDQDSLACYLEHRDWHDDPAAWKTAQCNRIRTHRSSRSRCDRAAHIRAAKGGDYNALVVTDGAGRKFEFLTQESLAPFGALFEAFKRHQGTHPHDSNPPAESQ